jgi:hypothetical protein
MLGKLERAILVGHHRLDYHHVSFYPSHPCEVALLFDAASFFLAFPRPILHSVYCGASGLLVASGTGTLFLRWQ